MKIFGYEIKKHRPDDRSPEEKMIEAVDDLNEAWEECRKQGISLRPWVLWEEKHVVISMWSGKPEVFYDSR